MGVVIQTGLTGLETSLDMSRNRKSSHPVLLLVICYGLYLTFCSAVCPLACLPSYLPAASLASNLGTEHPLVMWIVAGAAAGLHVAESLYCLHLTWVRLNMRPTVVLLWTVNILLAGIFGLWVLLFPKAFLSISGVYCRIPASFCYNVPR